MSDLDPELIDIYPVETSRSGTNAYYHFCHIRGGQQNYGVCMHIILAIEEGRIGADSFTDCQRAYTRGDCEARRMRDEEVAAGHALYYKRRTNVNPVNSRPERDAQDNALVVSSGKYDMSNPSFARGWHMAGGDSVKSGMGKANTGKTSYEGAGSTPPKPVKQAPPKSKSGFVEEGMADLVNAIANEKPKPKPAPQPQEAAAPSPAASLKPNPGETPIEFARRRAQLLKGAN